MKDEEVNGTIAVDKMHLLIDNCQMLVDSFEGKLLYDRKNHQDHIGNLWNYVFGLVVSFLLFDFFKQWGLKFHSF